MILYRYSKPYMASCRYEARGSIHGAVWVWCLELEAPYFTLDIPAPIEGNSAKLESLWIPTK